MYYPDPLTVRAVKLSLADTAKDAAMIGAASLVEGVIGSFWGYLFTRSNNRNYLNFIGELAGRALSPATSKIALDTYKNSNAYLKDGKWMVNVPAAVRAPGYLNDDGSPRMNNHSYDVVGMDTDLSNKFRYNFKSNTFKSLNRGPKPIQNQGKNKQFPRSDNRGDNRPPKAGNQILPVNTKNFSEVSLFDAVNTISVKPMDFSLLDAFTRFRDHLVSLFKKKSRSEEEFGKDLLKGCYEYLEENGYDPYPILMDAMKKNYEKSDFSEQVSTAESSDLTPDLSTFKDCARAYATLTSAQKDALRADLQSEVGKEASDEYIWSMDRFDSTGVPPTKRRLAIFKVLKVIAVAFGILLALHGVYAYGADKRTNK